MFSANTFTSTFVGYSFAFPGVAAYAASKSGLIGLTHYRRLDHLGTVVAGLERHHAGIGDPARH
jgi:NAD(P)-dependent dehydrogenase (short-subunit alcohol dehydrogenase family)